MPEDKKRPDRISIKFVECYNLGGFASVFEYGKSRSRYTRMDKERKMEIISADLKYSRRKVEKNEIRIKIARKLYELSEKRIGNFSKDEKRARKLESLASLCSLIELGNDESSEGPED